MNTESVQGPIKDHVQDPFGSPVFGAAVPLVGRVLLSAIFLLSGVAKLAAPAATKGGHFAAWEQPQLFSEEVRAAFRSLR